MGAVRVKGLAFAALVCVMSAVLCVFPVCAQGYDTAGCPVTVQIGELTPGAEDADEQREPNSEPEKDREAGPEDKPRTERSSEADREAESEDKPGTERGPEADREAEQEDKPGMEREQESDKETEQECADVDIAGRVCRILGLLFLLVVLLFLLLLLLLVLMVLTARKRSRRFERRLDELEDEDGKD